MAGARHGMCELTRQGNGMGAAWERYGVCELACTVTGPLQYQGFAITDTPHSVGLFWTSDRLFAKTST
jgi:hypothetical protein